MLVKGLQAPAAINTAQRHDQEHLRLKNPLEMELSFL